MDYPIQIVIADDHTLLRESLVDRLQQEPDLEVVGIAATGLETLTVIEVTQPDVLLLDLIMPESDQLTILPQLRGRSPVTKILLLADYFDQELLFPLLWEGAQGYILKSATCSDLVRALRAIAAGEAWIERSVVSYLLAELPRTQEEKLAQQGKGRRELLSARETEVARLVATGFSNKAIANRLSVSQKTVKSHLANIFKKLHINRRLQLALHCLQQDLLLNGTLSKETLRQYEKREEES
jgi:two-component system response regulator NreC